MNRKTIKELKKVVGAGNLVTAREDLMCYSYDGTGMEYMPSAVVFPGSASEVCRVMEIAGRERFPVIPRGAGTGMTGGALAVEGGLVMAMSRLDRILEIDAENQVAVVEPGVITGRFQEAVRRQGLFYPPDPASQAFCTMGGNVAECSGGPSAVKYGVTRDYVLGLEVILPSGKLIRTGVRTAKGVVGYDLTRLFIGSEGTLGIVTKIIVRLLALPTSTRTYLVLTDSLRQATELVAEILKSGILPKTLEYMDQTALQVVNEYLPLSLPENTRALLLVEVDGDRGSTEEQGSRLLALLADRKTYPGILATRQAAGESEAAELWKARRSISPATFRLRPHKISEDVVVPKTAIPTLVAFTEKLARELDLVILTFGHAGDGNIHVNIMADRGDAAEWQRAGKAKKLLFEQVIALSGTLSGEHGIGITKAPYLSMEVEEESLELMRKIKRVFDPDNILNPGKIFTTAQEKP